MYGPLLNGLSQIGLKLSTRVGHIANYITKTDPSLNVTSSDATDLLEIADTILDLLP